MKLASNDIPGAACVLEVSLNRGDSTTVLLEKLDAAISRSYRPHGQWTQREYDIAFLTKALGGPRLLYVLQQSHHFPSVSSLRRNKKLPTILISADLPTDDEINANISAMLGARPPPSNKLVGQTLMVDGIALEEVPRYDASRNIVLELCREHSSTQKKSIDTFADLEALRQGLDAGDFHYSKDGTIRQLLPNSRRHFRVLQVRESLKHCGASTPLCDLLQQPPNGPGTTWPHSSIRHRWRVIITSSTL
jgi:hypothetical protein